jgi:hypothetical protein
VKLTTTILKKIIREETERAIKEGHGEDYEESLELQLKRARRDGLEGKEAYEWAKKNLRSLGIHPPINKPALGRDALEEIGDIVDTPEFSDVDKSTLPDLETLDQEMEQVLNDMDRARQARDYAKMGELFTHLERLGLEVAKLQGLMNPEDKL